MKGAKYLLPLLSLVAVAFAVWHVSLGQALRSDVLKAPPIEPLRSPFEQQIAATGIIEAESKNIAVAAPVAGVVSRVFVEVGQETRAGEPIFQLDDRSLRGQLHALRAEVKVAEARLAELSQYPLPQEIPIAEAKIALAVAELDDFQDRLRRLKGMRAETATTKRELTEAKHAVAKAAARVRASRAEYQLLRAGAPEAAKDIARAEILLAQARIERVQQEVERLIVRAPIAGRVLSFDIRPGEYVSPGSTRPLVVVGSIANLHVLVQIDEHQIHRFRREARAVATPRGQRSRSLALELVRIEPLVTPKRILTGNPVERVDTRVLKVLYRFVSNPPSDLFVGQQIGVFIEVDSSQSQGNGSVRDAS